MELDKEKLKNDFNSIAKLKLAHSSLKSARNYLKHQWSKFSDLSYDTKIIEDEMRKIENIFYDRFQANKGDLFTDNTDPYYTKLHEMLTEGNYVIVEFIDSIIFKEKQA